MDASAKFSFLLLLRKSTKKWHCGRGYILQPFHLSQSQCFPTFFWVRGTLTKFCRYLAAPGNPKWPVRNRDQGIQLIGGTPSTLNRLAVVNHCLKGTFTHPVYACVYRIALHFFITYLGLLISMDKKVISSKTHRVAENACRNRMWQLGFKASSSEEIE